MINSLTQVLPVVNRQIRQNLWLTESGAVVGYGPLLAPTGFAYCFTCSTDQCQHVQALDEAWLAGQDSQENPFNGEPVTYEAEGYNQEVEYGIPPLW